MTQPNQTKNHLVVGVMGEPMDFQVQCLICKTRFGANNAAAVTRWLNEHEQDGTAPHRLHQIDAWLTFYANFTPDDLSVDQRLEEYERILRGALSGEDSPVVTA